MGSVIFERMANKMTKWNLEQDYKDIVAVDYIPWDQLRNKRILITGATGLIGTNLINALLYANKVCGLNVTILALVRDMERAQEKILSAKTDSLCFVVGSVEKLPVIDGHINYIIHGASQTISKEFVDHAVETIQTAVLGTMNLLELAKEKKVEGFVYLSSMEMYGYPEKGHVVWENEAGAMSPLDLRNSYPISKQMCESLCCAYVGEYGVPAKIARLTQTFGPGVNYNDTRIFAYFARCMVEKKNIVLKTRGETERCYLYTADAVTAILSILLKGSNGEAYNCANEETYCSISEMAEMVAKEAGIAVEYQIEDEEKNGFPQTLYMHLDTRKLKSLGWRPIGGVSNWLRCIRG